MNIVNGYVCKNCTDVEYAKKGIDPAHPKDGPNGSKKADKTGKDAKADHGPAVTFGGALAQGQQIPGQPATDAANGTQQPTAVQPAQGASATPYTPGSTVRLSA